MKDVGCVWDVGCGWPHGVLWAMISRISGNSGWDRTNLYTFGHFSPRKWILQIETLLFPEICVWCLFMLEACPEEVD
jgi:hypothetical protein